MSSASPRTPRSRRSVLPSDYVYLPASFATGLPLVVRGGIDFAGTAAAIRTTAAAELDPALIVRVDPLEANLDAWRAQAGLLSTLSLSLGALALTPATRSDPLAALRYE